jgi:hypothetical protein
VFEEKDEAFYVHIGRSHSEQLLYISCGESGGEGEMGEGRARQVKGLGSRCGNRGCAHMGRGHMRQRWCVCHHD